MSQYCKIMIRKNVLLLFTFLISHIYKYDRIFMVYIIIILFEILNKKICQC